MGRKFDQYLQLPCNTRHINKCLTMSTGSLWSPVILLQHITETLYDLPQFIVVWILQYVVVQIAHEMNQTLLMCAVHRVGNVDLGHWVTTIFGLD